MKSKGWRRWWLVTRDHSVTKPFALRDAGTVFPSKKVWPTKEAADRDVVAAERRKGTDIGDGFIKYLGALPASVPRSRVRLYAVDARAKG